MKAKFIDSTNLLMAERFQGMIGAFLIKNNTAYLKQNYSDQFHTSPIVDYEISEDNILVLHTLNSIYTFEILEGKFDASEIKKVPTELVEHSKKINTTMHKRWFCQIDALGVLDGVISTVTLPKAMTKAEAQQYILDNAIVDDSEGCLIVMLCNPIMEQKND